MRKTVALALFAALVTGMAASGAAQVQSNNTESSDVTVGVSSTSAIDIKPDSLDYNNVQVGNTLTQSDNSIGFTGVQIENIGSEGIDQIWAEATKPSERPFATGNVSKYDAGNFMMIQPPDHTASPSVNNYHFVNRREYNESNQLTYIETDPSSLSASANAQYYGRFRAGDQWYFWSIPVDTANAQPCDGTNSAALYVGNTPHSPTTTGTVDFTSSGTDWTNYTIQTTSANVGVAQDVNLTVDGTTRTYDVITNCNSGNVYTTRTRFNVRAEGTNDLTTAGDSNRRVQFLLSASSDSNNLKPGGSVAVPTAIQVPQGVAQGQTSQGSLTFFVSTET